MAALAIGVGYVAIIGLYVPMGAPPHGAEARLAYIAGHTNAWWAILWLSVLTDLLFLPLALALYEALHAVHRHAMMLAAIAMALFVVLDLALTWTNYAVLIELSGRYADAGTRSTVVAMAAYPAQVVESNLLFVYNTLTLAVGILIAGAVMLRGVFCNAVAWVGVATGVLGIISVVGPVFAPALSAAVVVTSTLTTVWTLMIGVRLLRLQAAP